MGSALSALASAIYVPIANGFESLSLNEPYQRGAVGLILGFALMQLAQPRFAYNEDGSAKQWSVFANEEQKTAGEGLTLVPWYLVPIIAALVLALVF